MNYESLFKQSIFLISYRVSSPISGSISLLQQFIEKITEGNDKGKYKCTMCGKINGQKIHTQNHIESIHFPGTFEYNCKHCDLSFSGRNKLYIHVNQMHKVLKY